MSAEESRRPSLSVLVTYHDERELLTECLDSLLASSGDDAPDEILVYDDASADPASGHLGRHARVRVIRGDVNIGHAAARNLLLREAAGEYVHFHDADDLFAAGWCGRVRESLAGGSVDLVMTQVAVIDPAAGRSWNEHYDFSILDRDPDLVRFALRSPSVYPTAVTLRKALAVSVGGFAQLRFCEDFDFHVRVFACRPPYRLVREPLGVQRLRTDSLSRAAGRQTLEVWTSRIGVLAGLTELLAPRYADELAEALFQRGAAVYALGGRPAAREAFRRARRVGSPVYAGRSPLYRFAARLFGAYAAERLSEVYRRFASGAWRAERQGGRSEE